jgi:hypothetical protein
VARNQLDEEEIFFEVKVLREAQINEILDDSTERRGFLIDEFLRQDSGMLVGFRWRAQLEPDIADTFSAKSKGDPDYGEHLAESSLRQAAEHLRLKDYEFCIPEVGHFIFWPPGTPGDSSISHFPVRPAIELARVLRNRLPRDRSASRPQTGRNCFSHRRRNQSRDQHSRNPTIRRGLETCKRSGCASRPLLFSPALVTVPRICGRKPECDGTGSIARRLSGANSCLQHRGL